MPDTHCRLGLAVTTALFSILVSATGCDLSDGPVADVQDVEPRRAVLAPIQADEYQQANVPKIAAEFEQILIDQAGPAAGNWTCKFDTFQFRLVNDAVAVTTPPGGFFTPFPAGIPTFDDPKLEDSYLFVVTMRDVNDNIVGFASEQEIADLVNNESKTSYTLTLPDRGTLMLTQRESFQVLIDAVNDMIADGVTQRTFDPPIIEILTIPGTGRVVGGSGEFAGKIGVMQEIGIVYEIDLANNYFDVGVIVQAFHC